MNEAWKKIFKDYVEDFDAICKLEGHGITSEENALELKLSLLKDIIVTMESEVKD